MIRAIAPEATQLNYKAAEADKKRKSPNTRIQSVDSTLTPSKRKYLTANVRDIHDNMAVCSWAVRRHLDYVSSFEFQPNTKDQGLNRELEELMEWYSRPLNCDATYRHSLPALVRMLEQRRTVDGDVFVIKLKTGHLQVIESDRVRTPEGQGFENLIHGVKVGKAGELRAIAVNRRNDRYGYELERMVRAGNVIHLGYFDRFDQVRGVSPLASAVNQFRDVMEASEYALARMKISQLFGLVFYRDSVDSFGDVEADGDNYNVDFGKSSGLVLDLEAGDRAEFLESESPHQEFQSFAETMTMGALKSLDIPISFFDESKVNYSSSRSAWIAYQKSTASKQRALRDMLNRLTVWRLGLFIQDGYLTLPSGMTLGQLRWDWVTSGTPWVDPLKEVRGDILAIAAGLKTRAQVVRERYGRDFREIADQLAVEQEYMEQSGVSTSLNGLVEINPQEIGNE